MILDTLHMFRMRIRNLHHLDIGKPYIKDPHAMLKELEEKKIYPIGRIVVFKDSVLAEKRPDLIIYGRRIKYGKMDAVNHLSIHL